MVSLYQVRDHEAQQAGSKKRTILRQDRKAFSNKEIVIENDESEGKRQDVVASSYTEEIANAFLLRQTQVSSVLQPILIMAPALSKPQISKARERHTLNSATPAAAAAHWTASGTVYSPGLASAPRRLDSLGRGRSDRTAEAGHLGEDRTQAGQTPVAGEARISLAAKWSDAVAAWQGQRQTWPPSLSWRGYPLALAPQGARQAARQEGRWEAEAD